MTRIVFALRALFAKCGPAAIGISLLCVLTANPEAKASDWPDTPPQGWWWYYGQTPDQVGALLSANKARLIDIQVENANPLTFTVAMVQNSGAYAKGWWWFFGLTDVELGAKAKELNARIVNLDAYQTNGGLRFAAILISNTGADAKSWWWYFGQTPEQLGQLAQQNNARFLDFRQHPDGGGTRYLAAMIANTAADASGWWWYYNIPAAQVSSLLVQSKAHLVSLQAANTATSTFNVVMQNGATPGNHSWWWYFGENSTELGNLVAENDAWLKDVKTYTVNGERVFTAIMSGFDAHDEWHAYRHDRLRSGTQPYASALSDPARVPNIKVKWQFPATGQPALARFAPPIVANSTVFAGNDNGYFYAVDAITGALKWQYPKAGDPPLLAPNRTRGINSSAAFWDRDGDGAVVFGAQDPTLGPFDGQGKALGSARLFAVNARTGALIWKSERVAEVTSSTPCDQKALYQTLHYSPILVDGAKAYAGVQSGEDPVQVGRVVAVDLANGHIDPNFHFQAVGTGGLGGGVWNGPASDGSGIYFTTGNVKTQDCSFQNPDPNPNHGLSLVRVDPTSGNLIWSFQPVPYGLDDDPDWSAGATIMSTSCGKLVASVQKDGWAYAVAAGSGAPGAPNVRWQFPPTGYPFSSGAFTHGDDGYRRPGAAWGDVFIVTTGGEARADSAENVVAGYDKVHALNVCAASEHDRVRWIADLCHMNPATKKCNDPYVDAGDGRGDWIGPPSVTGGLVYVGTNKGYLVVIADPSVIPATGVQCSNTDHTTTDCASFGFNPNTPVPKILFHLAMPDGGALYAGGSLRAEPTLARGRIFVGTTAGHLYMLEP